MSRLGVRILLIESDPAEARNLRQMLWEPEGLSAEITWLERRGFERKHLADSGADLVLLALSAADEECREALESVRAHARAIPIVVLASSAQEALARQAVAAGAVDYLLKGRWTPRALAQTIRAAAEQPVADRGTGKPSGKRSGKHSDRQTPRPERGRLLGLLGVKGGVGATTLVLNTAAVLARDARRVIAAELTPGCGGFAPQLGRPGGGAMENLLRQETFRLTESSLNDCLVEMAFGIRIVSGPRAGCGHLPPQLAETMLEVLSRLADLVVVDLPPVTSPLCQAALRACDVVVLVVDREPAAMEAGRAAAELLRACAGPEAATGAVIVNRTPLASLLSLAAMRAELKCEIVGVVPHDMALSAVPRGGTPFVVSHPESLAGESLVELAGRIGGMQKSAAFVG